MITVIRETYVSSCRHDRPLFLIDFLLVLIGSSAMTTPIPDDVWSGITSRLDIVDLNALMSVNKHLHDRLRENPRTWQTHLNACTDKQLTQIARTVFALAEPIHGLLKLREMTTLAGTGQPGLRGDGGPARQATLPCPSGVAVSPEGTVYVADLFSNRLRSIRADGTIFTVAGTGHDGYDGDGGPAHRAALHGTEGVAIGPDGTVYVTEAYNHCIRHIRADGTITTLAGTGHEGYGGDGGPARHAQLCYPHSVAVASDGSVYIADTSNHRIRRISADNVISTVAGTGVNGYGGDGGPAHHAQLSAPHSVAVASDGSVYIADTSNHRIRRISADNVISTVAGTGVNGYGGDSGPAHHAQLSAPRTVAVGPNGTVYVADTCNHRIRHIRADGTITTLAGTGHDSYAGDGGPAHLATVSHPRGIAVGPGGLVHITTGSYLRRFGTPH
ncbi:hypothetical protein ACFYPT_41450 [Streptomyces sp. NPDC005529]|uniref:NHL domain-containing protein n=1 Tax=unclassified Streptomyces TaxID=2593676 RepID=UPI00339E5F32